MSVIRLVTEELLRLLRAEVCATAAVVSPDDIFEVPKTPSLVLQGPALAENDARRGVGRGDVTIDETNNTFTETSPPRFYHLDFGIVVTAQDAGALIDLQERVTLFYQNHPTITFGSYGSLNITEVSPMGSSGRSTRASSGPVNLSNLRQASGQMRIEDCPVYASEQHEGGLIDTRVFEYSDQDALAEAPDETVEYPSDEGDV